MTVLWIDFESRSRCDLLVAGTYNYAQDPSTEIVLASYAVDMGPVERWEKFSRKPVPTKLRGLLSDPAVEIRAHNAAFERLLLKHCWKIDIAPARFHCTAFQSRACALPGALADMGRALTAKLQKDPRGYQLIRLLSIPREDGSFNEDPALYREFGDYCDRDVGAMRVASLMLPALDDSARRLWSANEIVNDRGLPIDTELCDLALHYAEREREEAQDRVVQLTGGALGKARGETLKAWLYERLPLPAQRLMEVKRAQVFRPRRDNPHGQKDDVIPGSVVRNALTLDADTRNAIFALAEESPEAFDDDVMAVLEANDAVTSASVYKFQSMRERASPDGRLRGAFIANGAAGTGRFSSHGAQLHNFPRACAKDPEAIKQRMRRKADLGGPVLAVLKSMLRPAISPGGAKRIVRADWNAVEARVLPWLTARASGVTYLDAFRDAGRDLYLEQAALCGLPGERQAGKVVVLALGYGGAEGALANMCKGYGVTIAHKRPVVQRWRQANRWAPEWWGELERGARTALRAPVPLWFAAGRVGLQRAGEGAVPGLNMMLPSGRLLYYPFAEADAEGIRYLKAAWKPKADALEWPRARLWGGLAAENATQAVAADLLREALTHAVERGLPVIGHVHDELMGEATSERAGTALAGALSGEMLTLPDWAAGLPLAVETDVAPRCRK